jgi:hypothetical protein
MVGPKSLPFSSVVVFFAYQALISPAPRLEAMQILPSSFKACKNRISFLFLYSTPGKSSM